MRGREGGREREREREREGGGEKEREREREGEREMEPTCCGWADWKAETEVWREARPLFSPTIPKRRTFNNIFGSESDLLNESNTSDIKLVLKRRHVNNAVLLTFFF